jgi:glycerophosphoryl diester phosphodiesterase
MTPWPYPRMIAHRGGGTLAPENTLAAIRTAPQYGYRGVEFDVMLSADARPVLIHDETLERTTSGRGNVADTSLAALAMLDAGGWKDPRFAGETVPAFEDAAKLCIELGLWANIEIKPARGHEAATGEIAGCIAAAAWRGAKTLPLISSFRRAALAAARASAPRFPLGWLVERIQPGWQRQLSDLGCVSLHCDQAHLTAALARDVKDAGYWLFCYTVNNPARARELFDWGVDAMVTDRLDVLPPD